MGALWSLFFIVQSCELIKQSSKFLHLCLHLGCDVSVVASCSAHKLFNSQSRLSCRESLSAGLAESCCSVLESSAPEPLSPGSTSDPQHTSSTILLNGSLPQDSGSTTSSWNLDHCHIFWVNQASHDVCHFNKKIYMFSYTLPHFWYQNCVTGKNINNWT